MQKELILVLVGIISTSLLSSFLSSYTQNDSDKLLLDTVVGVVGSGNFSYWQMGFNGPLLIELTSKYGDADLYVSEDIRPTYEVDKNNFSSATCGVDVVHIPADFPRPIGLGVFGHWSHELSEYSIKVYLDQSALVDVTLYHRLEKLYYQRQHAVGTAGEGEGEAQTDTVSNRAIDRESHTHKHRPEEETRPRFMKLLNILDMIFEMFVL